MHINCGDVSSSKPKKIYTKRLQDLVLLSFHLPHPGSMGKNYQKSIQNLFTRKSLRQRSEHARVLANHVEFPWKLPF